MGVIWLGGLEWEGCFSMFEDGDGNLCRAHCSFSNLLVC